ncbi:MAG: hypothetical protein LLF94_12615 [Chlamydiales bacterium]|nr:hypothetical protein [Chlamydiales bacterium]
MVDIPKSTYSAESQPVTNPIPSRGAKKLFQSNPLYQADTEYKGGRMPKISHLRPPAIFSYGTVQKDVKARIEVAKLLQPGDIIIMRVEKSKLRDIMDKVNWAHYFSRLLTVEKVVDIASEMVLKILNMFLQF